MVACYYDEANKKISFFRDKRSKSDNKEGGVRDGFLYDDTTASAGLEYFFNRYLCIH